MFHDMGREKDRGAAGMLFADQVFQNLLVDRIEPGEGFVEDQEIRLVGQVDRIWTFCAMPLESLDTRALRNSPARSIPSTHLRGPLPPRR
jgi:hypothetical protein